MNSRRSAWRNGIVTVALLIATVPILLIVVPAVASAHLLYGRWLTARWRRELSPRGKHILLVYSRSPHWERYIEDTWLPRIAPHAVVVNWSDRATWPKPAPLEIRVFRHWSGDAELNPLAVLVPARGQVRTIRFWRAFRDFKHGKAARLRDAEAELFAFVDGIQKPS